MNLKRLNYLFSFSGFLAALSFSTPIWMVFMTGYLHFSLETAINLSMLVSLTIVLFEVWSGSWSDRFGRKKIFFLGGVAQVLSTIVYIYASSVPYFIFSALLMGLGYAMMSGNIEAIVHDILVEKGKEEEFAKLQSSSYGWTFLGRAGGSILGGYFYLISPTLPYIANLFVLLFLAFSIFLYGEGRQMRAESKNDFQHIIMGIKHLVRDRSLVIAISIIIYVSSLGNIYWFTYQEYFRLLGLDIYLFGWLYAGLSLVSGVSSFLLGKILEKKYHSRRLILVMMLLTGVSSLFFAFPTSLWSLIGLVTVSAMFGWVMTLGNTLVLNATKNTHKSMAVSLFSLFMTLGYVLFTFVAGFFIERYGLREVYGYLLMSIFITGIFGFLLIFSLKKM